MDAKRAAPARTDACIAAQARAVQRAKENASKAPARKTN
jgi:hypothetical protein